LLHVIHVHTHYMNPIISATGTVMVVVSTRKPAVPVDMLLLQTILWVAGSVPAAASIKRHVVYVGIQQPRIIVSAGAVSVPLNILVPAVPVRIHKTWVIILEVGVVQVAVNTREPAVSADM